MSQEQRSLPDEILDIGDGKEDHLLPPGPAPRYVEFPGGKKMNCDMWKDPGAGLRKGFNLVQNGIIDRSPLPGAAKPVVKAIANHISPINQRGPFGMCGRYDE